MARINVDDGLDSDQRFKALVRRLGGDDEKALGKVVLFWKLAQKHWGDEKALVPEPEFALGDWQQLLDVGLAERRDSGIYARGAEERFAWYLEQCRKNRKLAAARAARRLTLLADQNRTTGTPPGPPPGVPTVTVGNPDGHPPAPALVPVPVLDRETEIVVPDAGTDSRTRLPVRSLARLWNEHKHPAMPEVDPSKLSTASPRYRFARQRLVEQPDLDYWRQVIERIAASPFCRGENQRGWRADFAFLVRAETHLKVLEGKYDDRAQIAAELRKAREKAALDAIFGAEGSDAAQ